MFRKLKLERAPQPVLYAELIMDKYSYRKIIGDRPILLAEALASHEAIRTSILAKVSKVIIQNDSQIALRAIMGGLKAPSIITNTVVIF